MALCTLSFPAHFSQAAASNPQRLTPQCSHLFLGVDLQCQSQQRSKVRNIFIFWVVKQRRNYCLGLSVEYWVLFILLDLIYFLVDLN